jgi:hypothetical protein
MFVEILVFAPLILPFIILIIISFFYFLMKILVWKILFIGLMLWRFYCIVFVYYLFFVELKYMTHFSFGSCASLLLCLFILSFIIFIYLHDFILLSHKMMLLLNHWCTYVFVRAENFFEKEASPLYKISAVQQHLAVRIPLPLILIHVYILNLFWYLHISSVRKYSF